MTSPTSSPRRLAVVIVALLLPVLGTAGAGEPVAIVADDEPGEALLIRGTVTGPDGEPVAGARVHVHQANKDGVYTRLGSGESERIEGEAVTDAAGRYAFRTIRPAAYPGGDAPPPHVHYVVTGPSGARKTATLRVRGEPSEIVFDIALED